MQSLQNLSMFKVHLQEIIIGETCEIIKENIKKESFVNIFLILFLICKKLSQRNYNRICPKLKTLCIPVPIKPNIVDSD